MTFTCTCGATAEHHTKSVGAYNVGHAMEETGFFPLFSSWGEDVWLCPSCRDAADALAKALLAVVRNENLVLAHIVRKNDRKPTYDTTDGLTG